NRRRAGGPMLDIGVGDALHQFPDSNEPSLGFEDDGYYWFLHPLFERLAAETGLYIDLYGSTMFAGPHLAALSRMLSEARRWVKAQPERWRVRPTAPPEQRQGVSRREFLRLLSTWESAVSRAQELRRAVTCFGD